ncbi:MAG: response regulator [Xanthomonadales bacterium]|nr:response regulator [Xanthomonadales bacterium]
MAKILIVDDVLIMRNILRVMLENVGHEIIGNAENGQQAVEMFEQLKPDLVTLDIQMEGGDGMTTLGKIMQRYPEARVLMVTAIDQNEVVEEAIRMGAKGYVTKPFQAEDVLQQTQKALA